MICLYIKNRLFWHYYWSTRLRLFVLSWFLFHGMVRNGIPKVNFFLVARVVFSSAEWFGTEFREFASILVLRNGIPRIVFSSAEGFGTEWWEFASFFVQRNGIPSCFRFRGRIGIPRFSVPGVTSEIIICSVYNVFRGIFFCRKFPTLPTDRGEDLSIYMFLYFWFFDL